VQARIISHRRVTSGRRCILFGGSASADSPLHFAHSPPRFGSHRDPTPSLELKFEWIRGHWATGSRHDDTGHRRSISVQELLSSTSAVTGGYLSYHDYATTRRDGFEEASENLRSCIRFLGDGRTEDGPGPIIKKIALIANQTISLSSLVCGFFGSSRSQKVAFPGMQQIQLVRERAEGSCAGCRCNWGVISK